MDLLGIFDQSIQQRRETRVRAVCELFVHQRRCWRLSRCISSTQIFTNNQFNYGTTGFLHMTEARREFLVVLGTLSTSGLAGCSGTDDEAEIVADIINSNNYDRARDDLVEAVDAYEMEMYSAAEDNADMAESLFEGLLLEARREARSDNSRRVDCMLRNLESHFDLSLTAAVAIQDAVEARRTNNLEQAQSEYRRAANAFDQAADLAGGLADDLENQNGPCS